MRLQSMYKGVGTLDRALVSAATPRADAQVRRFDLKLLEITVGGLLVIWWLQMFGLWSGFLSWAASIGVPREF